MKNKLMIPTLKEWGKYDNDLDLKEIHKLFFGKSNSDVYYYYKNMACISRADELLFLNKKVFQYYIYSFVLYLLSDLGKDDDEAKEVFLSLLISREKHDSKSVCEIYEKKVKIECIDENFDKDDFFISLYDIVCLIKEAYEVGEIDKELYDKLPDLIIEIEKKCQISC